MSEVTSVNGKTGAVVLKAAEVEAVAISEVGQPSGVASLNSSGKLPETQLPSSVEIGSPPPTGVAATDTANAKAALKAAGEANGVAVFNKPGTYAISEELVRPHTASVVIGPNTILQAASGFSGTALLTDSATEKSEYRSIVGGGILDSNGHAKHALWCRYFGHMTLGVVCQNSTEDDVILGDNVTPATAASYECIATEAFWINRTTGTVPVGHYALWLQRCSDSRFFGTVVKGQETGIRTDSAANRFYGVHPYGAGYAMQVCVDDNSAGNEWFGPNYDTPTPKEHAGATGSTASATITDTEILAQHEGRPVSGTNIPAESFVGTVTAATSFVLVNSKGTEAKPTGEVKGVTLAGVGHLCRASGFNIVGGEVFVSTTYGVDNGCYGVVFGKNINNGGFMTGFSARGGEPANYRVTQALIGNTSSTTWAGLIQINCVKTVTPAAQINGALLETKSPSTPGLLARVQYAPASESKKTTESTSLVAVDSTNLKVAFVAPPSGDVFVRLEAMIENETGGDKVVWALLESSTQKGPAGIASPSNTVGIRPLTILVTGLEVGKEYTWEWAWAVSAGKALMVVQAVASPWTNAASPATIEVWAA